jgi:hypothetical protein
MGSGGGTGAEGADCRHNCEVLKFLENWMGQALDREITLIGELDSNVLKNGPMINKPAY